MAEKVGTRDALTNFIMVFAPEITNESDNISLLAVQGPNAQKMLQPLTNMDLDMVYYTVQRGTFAGVDNVIISTTGYTGAGGYEVYFRNEEAELKKPITSISSQLLSIMARGSPNNSSSSTIASCIFFIYLSILGMVNQNVLPCPGFEVKPILPL